MKTTRSVRQTIREQAEHGVTSVVISTDLDELLDLCDRIAVLSRGRVAGVVDNGPDAAARDRRADGRREGRSVTDAAAVATGREEPPSPSDAADGRAGLGPVADFLLRSILPLVLALGTGAIVLAAIGVDPIQYYQDIWSGGVAVRRLAGHRRCGWRRCC